MKKFLEKIPVGFVEMLKKRGIHPYQTEMAVVLCLLSAVAIISEKGLIEWIGVVAVFLTFGYSSVSDRLREVQEVRAEKDKHVEVECYRWLNYYFWGKEILWFFYFLFLGAWSALAGVFIFLLYPFWRRLWRKYHPLTQEYS